MKRIVSFFAIASVCMTLSAKSELEISCVEPFGAWWSAPDKPHLSAVVRNCSSSSLSDTVALEVYTDRGKFVYAFSNVVSVPPADSVRLSFDFNLAPGFYKCVWKSAQKPFHSFNIGFEPERIVALSDEQPDFDAFWLNARRELDSVAPEFTVVEDTTVHSASKRAFHVTMKSLGDELLRCYLLVPRKDGNYPAIIHFQGYNQGPWKPDIEARPDFIEFVLSVRGQGWNKPYNTHGPWLVENIHDPLRYYYRGAYMDVIRGLDFVSSLPQYDGKNLFAEGLSQGGLLTLVAVALDDRVVAAAPCCPFLGDIPSYLELGSEFAKGLMYGAIAEHHLSPEQFRTAVSYFDLRSLCRRIKVPVYFAVGLQDPICAPYTNFAGYNAIPSYKEFVIYPHMQHNVDKRLWEPAHLDFFRRYMK